LLNRSIDFVQIIVPEVAAIQNNDDLADAKLDLAAFAKVCRVLVPIRMIFVILINPSQRADPFGKKLNSSETATAAQKYSQAFTDLRRELEAFKGTFDDFAKDHQVELEKGITDKEAEILKLQLEIKK